MLPTEERGTYIFGRLFPKLATAKSVYSFASVNAFAADPIGSYTVESSEISISV